MKKAKRYSDISIHDSLYQCMKSGANLYRLNKILRGQFPLLLAI